MVFWESGFRPNGLRPNGYRPNGFELSKLFSEKIILDYYKGYFEFLPL
jgi:hypothetical protein